MIRISGRVPSFILREAGIGGVVYLQFNVNEFGAIQDETVSNPPIRNWIKRHSTPFRHPAIGARDPTRKARSGDVHIPVRFTIR